MASTYYNNIKVKAHDRSARIPEGSGAMIAKLMRFRSPTELMLRHQWQYVTSPMKSEDTDSTGHSTLPKRIASSKAYAYN
jgi:hypothetical protein